MRLVATTTTRPSNKRSLSLHSLHDADAVPVAPWRDGRRPGARSPCRHGQSQADPIKSVTYMTSLSYLASICLTLRLETLLDGPVGRLIGELFILSGVVRLLAGFVLRKSQRGGMELALASYLVPLLFVLGEVYRGTTSTNTAMPMILINGASCCWQASSIIEPNAQGPGHIPSSVPISHYGPRHDRRPLLQRLTEGKRLNREMPNRRIIEPVICLTAHCDAVQRERRWRTLRGVDNTSGILVGKESGLRATNKRLTKVYSTKGTTNKKRHMPPPLAAPGGSILTNCSDN